MTQTEQRSGTAEREVQNPWGGHYPVTRTALEAVLMRASSGRKLPSVHDCVLVTGCEFRSVIASGELAKYLRTDTLRKLGAARFALHEIGAMDATAILSTTIAGLRRTSSQRSEAQLLLKLEWDLLVRGRMLDELIARYAVNLPQSER